MTPIPILETERLVLRGWRPEDFEFYAVHMADPEVTRFITPLPTRADAWRNMATVVGHWVLRGYGFWAVERKEDGILLGRVGLWSPEGWPRIEVGWALGKPYWNQGYGTEAARASLAHGFRTLSTDNFVSHIDRNNLVSAAVAKKLGQKFIGEMELVVSSGRSHKVDRWQITREQWGGARMIDAPTIETKRLILRGFKPDDFDVLAQFMMDPQVTRYLSGQPQSRADAWRSYAAIIGHWVLRGYGFWAVERKEDGAFIGRIGLWNPEGWPGMEVGWTLGRPYWGQGYATEAAQASLDYGFLTYPVETLLSVIHTENRASQKVAERLGETKGVRTELVIAGRSFPVDVWEIAREKWLVSRF